MNEPIFSYDEMSDTMFISFEPAKEGTGIELNEQILLRVDEDRRCAVGLTLFNYSVLAQPTEIGHRSLPLTGLDDLPAETREMVIEILHGSEVGEILSFSAYTPSVVETIPITSLQDSVLERRAA
ncbi:MAG: DUF2283 domain-containing protein [Acidobacteria bacterium]|nr:DUF2283 domain-containing protein [Acidobacteriota bacterium]